MWHLGVRVGGSCAAQARVAMHAAAFARAPHLSAVAGCSTSITTTAATSSSGGVLPFMGGGGGRRHLHTPTALRGDPASARYHAEYSKAMADPAQVSRRCCWRL